MTSMVLKHSLLLDSSLSKLRSFGIISINNFLDTDDKLLARVTQLDATQITIIKNYFRTMYEIYLPVKESEHKEMIERNHKENRIYQTGIPEIDKRIKGITQGSLMELVGEPESGKSKLCTSIAINFLVRYSCESYWIDTKMDFSPIAMEREMRQKFEVKNTMIKAMKKIHVMRAFTLEDVIKVLEHLMENESIEPGLLVLDSLSSLMCEYLGKRYRVGEEGLRKISNYIRNICHKKKFIAIVTVIPRQDKRKSDDNKKEDTNTGQIKSILQNNSTERLFITRTEKEKVQNVNVRNSNKRSIFVMKSLSDKSCVSNVPVLVSLTDEGVV